MDIERLREKATVKGRVRERERGKEVERSTPPTKQIKRRPRTPTQTKI